MSTAFNWSRCSLLLLLLLSVQILQAQIAQSKRLEILVTEEDADRFKAAGLAESGLMLYRRLSGKKNDQLELIKIDTALKENWKGYISISKNLMLLQVRHRHDLLFLLFKDRNYTGGDFQIVAIKINNGDYGNYTVKNLIPFSPTEFIITNQAAMIGGYFNYRPIVLYFNFSLQRSKVLPGFFNSPGELNQLKTYDDGSVDVIVSAKNFEKRRALWIRNYDPQGELIKTTILQPEEGKNLIFGRSVKLPNGEQIVAGVYGRFTEYSRGIFVAEVNTVGEYGIVYYNFAQLENFFSYMKAKRQKRVKDRIERKTIRGKKVKFNYRLLIHDIIPYQDQYIMAGEAFYPHYSYPHYAYSAQSLRYSTFTGSIPSFYSNPLVRSDLIFDGYQYTHAVVIGFDKNGKLKWDNSFEINDIRTMQLEQFVKIKPESDRLVLMYLYDNNIRTKIIRDSQVIEGKAEDKMKNPAGDALDIRDIESEQLDYWYGDYFYAFGIQRTYKESSYTGKLLYIQKLTYK